MELFEEQYFKKQYFIVTRIQEGLNQGCNARKVNSEVYAFFVLQCTDSELYINTSRMSQPDMESTFHIKKNILVIGIYNYVNYQNLLLFSSSRILEEH